MPISVLAVDADYTTTWDGLLEVRWDWDVDGNRDTRFAAANLTPTLILTQTGRYPLAMEVQDRFGASALASTSLDIFPPSRLTLASPVNLTVIQNTEAIFSLPLGNAGGQPLTYTLTVADPQSVTYAQQNSLVTPGYVATAPPWLAADEGHSGQLPLNFEFPFFGRV